MAMSFKYIESIYDKILQEGYKNLDDFNFGSEEWREKVNTDVKFNKKIQTTLNIKVYNGERDFVDVTCELWFNGSDPISVNYSMIDCHLMEGDKGPIVESMGSVVWVGEFDSKLCLESVGRLIPLLRKIKYKGPISIHLKATEDKLYGEKIILQLRRGNKIDKILDSKKIIDRIPVHYLYCTIFSI